MTTKERQKNIKSAAEQRVQWEKERWGVSPLQLFSVSTMRNNLEIAKEILPQIYDREKQSIKEEYEEEILAADTYQEALRLRRELFNKLQHLYYRLWHQLDGMRRKCPRMDHYTQISSKAGPRKEKKQEPVVARRLKDNIAKVKQSEEGDA